MRNRWVKYRRKYLCNLRLREIVHICETSTCQDCVLNKFCLSFSGDIKKHYYNLIKLKYVYYRKVK